MEDRKPPPTRNPSRTLAKIGLAVLVLITIAGIVLATLQRDPPVEEAARGDATQTPSAPMTAASAQAVAAEAEAGPTQVVFAPDSAQLSTAATAKLLHLAEMAKAGKQRLTIIGRVEARPEGKEQRTQLARTRAIAVRGVLEANGVPLPTMETRIEGMASGPDAAKGANRIEVKLR